MGAIWSASKDLFAPETKFTAENVPDMSGKVVLVTGATSGIGKETARVLLTKNAKVWVTARDNSKGEATLKELKESTGKEGHLLLLNLANLKNIKASADEFLSKESQLHVLFNNAGVMNSPMNLLTDDGYDLQFGTNVLGHFYFTTLLLPILISTTKASPDGAGRVVNTSSNGHWYSPLKFGTWKDGPARRKEHTFAMYSQSKAGNIVFSAELQRRFGAEGIISTSLNPGAIRTEVARHHGAFVKWIATKMFCDVSYGALTQLYAGTSPEGSQLGGKYLVPWARLGEPRADTQDEQLGKELWAWLEEQVASTTSGA
ncbi:hypothetical protein HYDPIDRAFT_159026 [Hydnomerulius pinastri MD-312]|uniref:NAD(P)-binding protein n=1 Tax=Hydnomerulius pinastri MD-312 TaxID=994086 RepID=A0A0C9WCM6_9AGAM|nr:hypothetical protein HYDPIDRAFT_159026 [Hydnomerulius pinastri MD-312]